MNEDALEQLAIFWFQEIGWDYVCGYDIAPDSASSERSDWRQVVLEGRLRDALRRLNPGVPENTLDEVVRQVRTRAHPGLLQSNQAFHELLLHGVPIEVEENGVKRGSRAHLVDFAKVHNNQFLVVNQFTIAGTQGNRRPDLVCFLNGLPIAVIELKNMVKEDTGIWEAFHQFTTYKAEIAELFVFNAALVISDGMHARVGSLTAEKERFQPWRVVQNEDDRPLLEFELEKLVRGFFHPELLLDFLRYFVLFETGTDTEGGMVKKIAGYHQFHAVREVVRTTLIAANPRKDERVRERRALWGEQVEAGGRKGGIVWHTQGSGKSISMVCFAAKLIAQPEMRNPTLVVVTDRNDLDGQLYQTFKGVRGLIEAPLQIESTDDLKAKLVDRQTGGIIFTTIQKFRPVRGEARFPVLSARENIVVIADEAHRSQYGLEARLNRTTGEYTYGYATHLRSAFPNATFVGFTGTPIESADKDTRAIFGDYVSVYDIQDAVDDGATVPIYYESRLAKLDINRPEIDAINQEVEDVLEDEESLAEREATKSKWAQLAKLVGAEPRLKEVAADLVTHFAHRNQSLEGKGLVVCMSREICVALYDALIALHPAWHDPDPTKGALKIVMTGSAQDKDALKPHLYSSATKKVLEKRFKDPGDPLQLVIVRDMWLTGFDAPCLHTLYIDKPMKGHNLMQAIARVNRVFGQKEGGLVVDYIGIAAELRQALKNYTENRGKGAPTIDNDLALQKLFTELEIARGLLYGFDYTAYADQPLPLLVPAANFLLDEAKIPEGRKRWLDTVLRMDKALSLCSTRDEVTPALRQEIAFFQAVRVVILKASAPEKQLTKESKSALLKQILDNAVLSQGVEDIFALARLTRPNLGILSGAFLDDVRRSPNRYFAIELLERLLRDELKARMRTNVVRESKYGDRLQSTLRRYHSRAIESAHTIEELIQLAQELQEEAQRGDKLALSDEELAFYDALTNDPSAAREMSDDTLKAIARELTEKLRKSTTIDWQKRESVRARLRNLVRITLRRHKYPPTYTDDAVQLVLTQTERLADAWSRG